MLLLLSLAETGTREAPEPLLTTSALCCGQQLCRKAGLAGNTVTAVLRFLLLALYPS